MAAAARPSLAIRLALVCGAGALIGFNLGGVGSPEAALARVATPESRSFTLCRGAHRTNCVVDGDTFWMDGEKIRIADIDTPETHPPRCPREAALGAQATLRLHALLNAGPFALEPASGRDVDRYGRKLRIVERDGRSLGATLVAEGLAREWTGRRLPWCA